MRMKLVLTWRRLAALAALGLVGAFLVGWTGFVSIAASSGHFALTRWYLGWTMENAVETQSIAVRKPEGLDLSDPALVRRAAGHFATGCAPCHGAPGVPQSPVVRQMTPTPPRLEGKVGDWSDEELFWIVRNGIKYSGMPAWPAPTREDEVWAQVAFLRALPGLSRADYARLALGEEPAEPDLEPGGESLAALDGIVEEALQDCARCHGRDGLGRDVSWPAGLDGDGSGRGEGSATKAFPVIAGQPEPYLHATLRAFALGHRDSGFMEPPATRHAPEVLAALARHYAAQPAPAVVPGPPAGPAVPPVPPGDGAGAGPAGAGAGPAAGPAAGAGPTEAGPADGAVEPGPGGAAPRPEVWQDAAGVLEGAGDLGFARVPTAAASGPPATREELLALGRRIALEGLPSWKLPACQSCHGAAGRAENPFVPYLEGQPEWYLAQHLHLWREGRRGGTAYAHLMVEIAGNMTDEQIEAVAAWYSEAVPPAP